MDDKFKAGDLVRAYNGCKIYTVLGRWRFGVGYLALDAGDGTSPHCMHVGDLVKVEGGPTTPPNTLTLKAKVIYYPQTGRYTIYGTNEAEATDLVIADLAHDIEGHGPYVMFEVNATLPIPETKVYNVTVTPFEGDNYD